MIASLRDSSHFHSRRSSFSFSPSPPPLISTTPTTATTSYGNNDICVIPTSLQLWTEKAYKTQKNDVFQIKLLLRLFGMGSSSIEFSLSGVWDSVSGKLCLVGPGLVNGTLESLDSNQETDFDLKPLSILGVNLGKGNYELIDKESESNDFRTRGKCRHIGPAQNFELEYMSDCNRVNCDFLGRGDNYNNSILPSVMYMNRVECLEDNTMRFLLEFEDYGENELHLPFIPNTALITEGKWDAKQKRLNMVGCRIFSDLDEGFVGNCSIRLSLRFPANWNLIDRSIIVGEMWSSKSINETGYFGRVMLSRKRNNDIRAPSVRYDYTELDKSKTLSPCAHKIIPKGERKLYPKPLSPSMRFDLFASNKKVSRLSGESSPVFVGSQGYMLPSLPGMQQQNLRNLLTVSYALSVGTTHDFKLSSEHKKIQSFDISAEGFYDSESGHVYMIGCMQIGPPRVRMGRNLSLDCEIVVDIQYHPVNVFSDDDMLFLTVILNPNEEEVVNGTIKSTREKSDDLYFEPFEFTSRSIYQNQAKDTESIWRIDLEITMVLISNTLSCVFVGFQLLHVKRHPNVLPLISVVMLVVLTLGHLIPLLLNFEGTVNFYFGVDEWLEVNEVLVRVITMIAFLLDFHLLQMAWSSRSADKGQKNLWTPDKKVLYPSAPLYISFLLIAWLVHLSRKLHKKPSLLDDMKLYGGLILDGFLLPQILFNISSDSKEKVIAPFYVETSVARLLPHVFGYIYANPRLDYNSEIFIWVWGFLFVVLIYLPATVWRAMPYTKEILAKLDVRESDWLKLVFLI
ncbi:hypothetical protein CASFOL_029133 [Castilleja foliolosa]|uniref:RING-type E3 ubiquitin transferase n=1 Tax=Castilleja foliolosa TaxID=1961234 RepID=A0ABD3CD09_9LAMI